MNPPIALGFRVKSGYAIAVALSGSPASPTAVARRIVELSDPSVAATKQPYHDGFGTAQQDSAQIAQLTRIVERCAMHSVRSLLDTQPLAHRTCRASALVVGSLIDPARVGNLHIRAHAHEGRLFRTVLEQALRECGVKSAILLEKTLAAEAAKRLRRSTADIGKTLSAFGRTLGAPWRSDEKSAAMAAWMSLSF